MPSGSTIGNDHDDEASVMTWRHLSIASIPVSPLAKVLSSIEFHPSTPFDSTTMPNEQTTSGRPLQEGATDHMPKATTTKEKILWSGLWFLLLLLSCFISWFTCGVWIVLMPLETFWEPLRMVNMSLQHVIMWPRILGIAVKESHMKFTNPLE